MQCSNDHKVTFFASMIRISGHQMWSTCNFAVSEIFASSTRESSTEQFNDFIHPVWDQILTIYDSPDFSCFWESWEDILFKFQ